jgi:hypothetical protein
VPEADEITPTHPVIRSENSWGMLRAVSGNLRLAHADLLHVDLWWRGQNIVLDPGTFLYNGKPPWDNPWPSSRYHNTVTINQADQMTRAGRFMYLDWPTADWSHDGPEIRASHNGYRRFGVKHQRTLKQDENGWIVKDEILPDGDKFASPISARLHWLLPDWEWELEKWDSGFGIRLKSTFGWITMHITIDSQSPNNDSRLTLVRAGEVVFGQRDVQSVEGWFSPTYGTKVPALSLAFEVQSGEPIFFTTEFIFSDES